MKNRSIGLYIHIPFCKSICKFCDFTKKIPFNNEINCYVNRLIKEINSYHTVFQYIDTIYIGGGSPSSLPLKKLEEIFETINAVKATEFTIELNPEQITCDLLALLKKYRVNRLSIGIQTFNKNLLTILGRSGFYTIQDIFNKIKAYGFHNISIDLIYGIPNQTINNVLSDIKKLTKLDINHVSFYSLEIHDKTMLSVEIKKNIYREPTNYLVSKMFEVVINELPKHGFKQYEIANFAKTGFESIHNKKYWELKEYIGCGLSASSFYDNYRYTNPKKLCDYLEEILVNKEHVTHNELLNDTFLFGLRLLKGVDYLTLEKKYGFQLFDKYPQLINFVNQGLLLCDNQFIKLTKKGILLANNVFLTFV